MKNPVIVDAIRSPMARAKPDGALAQLHPVDLLSQVLQQLVERNKIDPGQVDDVICGCVSQAGEQAGTPGRLAWLAAGLPAHVPSTTIDRKCGSSQQAVHFAAQAIMAGTQDIVIACGVDSMSRVPLGSSRMGKNTTGPRFDARYAPGLVGQGLGGRHHQPRATVLHDVGHLGRCQVRAQHGGIQAGLPGCQRQRQDLDAVFQHHREALARLQALGVEPLRHRHGALRHFAGGEARACLGHDQYHPVGSCRRAAKEVLHTCHPLLLGAPPWGLESPKNAKCMSHKNVV